MHLSKQEKKELLIAYVLLSITFSIFLAIANSLPVKLAVITSFLVVAIGFVIHELAHKMMAERFGKYAEFKANFKMLVLSMLLSPVIIIAAPGAVHISGYVNKRESGIIALAGPLANLLLSLIMMLLFFTVEGNLRLVLGYGYYINALLAVFNLIPIPGFDGEKIIIYDKLVYFIMGLTGVILIIVSNIILG